MPSVSKQQGPPRVWRSLAELAEDPEFRAFVEAEFPEAAEEIQSDGFSRRRWLQLMGASLALAGVSGCRWEKEEILPFAVRPANRLPGIAQRYATAMDVSGFAPGLKVTSSEGRPIKVEGNAKHPQSLGATSVVAQAAILQLYDPDRSAVLRQRIGQEEFARTWDELAAFLATRSEDLRKKQGEGLAIVTEASSSPTMQRLRKALLGQLPKARWVEYEAVSRDNQRAGSKLAFGKVYRTQLALDRARVILAVDSDLLGSHPAAVLHTRHFTAGRDASGGQMNRLYAVESVFSLTGAAADHRLALRSGQIAGFVAALEQEIGKLLSAKSAPSASDKSKEENAAQRFLRVVAADLVAQRGQGVVAVGPRQPAAVHAAAHRINAALGNAGKTVAYTLEADQDRPSHAEALQALAVDAAAGKVQTLLILGGNPAYDAPADVDFAQVLSKIGTRIHLSLYEDETSELCDWHLPQAHFLEAWGDARSYDGTYSVVQPLIEPLHGGKSAIEVLALLHGWSQPKADELVRDTFKDLFGTERFEKQWAETLQNGLLPDSRWPTEAPALVGTAAAEHPTDHWSAAWSGGDLELVFVEDSRLYDGRFANSGWLQELPEPMTKLVWDNAALMSPATAKALGVVESTLVELDCGGRKLQLPASIMPGQAAGSVTVVLGFGRTAAGHVGGSKRLGVAPVGVNVYPLRTAKAMHFCGGLMVRPTGEPYDLAGTMNHHAIDAVGYEARAKRTDVVVREANLEHYRQHPEFAKELVEIPPLKSLWSEPNYDGHRWGMSIDLSKCTGCSACVVACQAENNIPVVGKPRVLKGREMHWIRLDRYFQGEPEEPKALIQPVACQQCELAPCEQVCPVAATVHSKEGLNDMVYNRCVGTRYCANNCPYKVRRFNYFNFHKDLEDPANAVLKMVYNPEVTVRSRGVMEKCTYCVQRIQAAKIAAKNLRRPIADGEIQTACQQACPAQAIEFGDLADLSSRVAKAQASDRAYGLLAELNFKPRTAYLAKIRNPHPDLG